MPVACSDCQWRGPRVDAGETGAASCPHCGADDIAWVPARPGTPAMRTVQPA